MSKQKPPDFDPHPGDPWHPDWAPGDEASSQEAEPDTDADWWQALRSSSPASESTVVPEAYAALGSSPDAGRRGVKDTSAESEDPEPTIAVSHPAVAPDAATVAAVARAFEGEMSGQVIMAPTTEPEPTITVDLRLAEQPAHEETAPVAPVAAPAEEAEPEATALPAALEDAAGIPGASEARVGAVELDDEGPPAVAPVVAGRAIAASVDQALVPAEKVDREAVASVGDAFAAATPGREPSQAQVEESAARSANRAAEHAAELSLVAVLTLAEQTAHEESQMWRAIAAAREALEAEHLPIPTAPSERAPRGGDAWAAEALAIEQSRQRFEESRRHTEAELRHTLEAALDGAPPPAAAGVDEGAAVAAKFRAIGAQLQLEEAAEGVRADKREALRLHTSLLVLEAEEPWEDRGWSRPGRSMGAAATLLAPSFAGPGMGADPGAAVAESAPRRRWPFARRRKTPAAPTGHNSLEPVPVVEEQAVAEREDDTGDEGQSSLPFDDRVTPGREDAEATPPGLDDDLAAWSDLDWDLEDDEADVLVPDRSAPDSVDASDDSSSPPDADWEDFTAEQYVKTATREYADLAAAVAAAETEETHQAAISADMPGMESSLVGLEDVVEAEGMEMAAAAPRSDLALRVVTGLGLVALFFASLTYRWSIGLLVVIVMALAAGELATVLLRQGRHPVALFAYAGTLGSLLGTWAYGPVAIPFVAAASILVVAMYFGLVAGREDPATSLALTLVVVLWVGVLASFAMDMVSAAEYRWLIASLVVVVAVMDMAQYFVGKRFGKRRIAPVVSPKKTVAGLVGGVIAAIATGYGLSFIAPYDPATGIVLGAAMALTGPLGDLAVSVLKRTLGVKDMGTILPGHGGVLDRIDAILYSLPAAWIVFAWAGLLV